MVAEIKRWKSGYWHNWFNAFRFVDDSDAVNDADILVAESEGDDDGDDCKGFNWIAEVELSEVDDDSSHTWSAEDSPPVTDNARRGKPAVDDHHAQGGLLGAKLHVGDGGSQSRRFHPHATGKTTMPASTAASRFEAAEFALSYLPDVVQRACDNSRSSTDSTEESRVQG